MIIIWRNGPDCIVNNNGLEATNKVLKDDVTQRQLHYFGEEGNHGEELALSDIIFQNFIGCLVTSVPEMVTYR